MSNDADIPKVSNKFDDVLAMLDAMTDEEVLTYHKNVSLHIAIRFQDCR